MTVISAAGRHAILWVVVGIALSLIGSISVRGLIELFATLAIAWAASDLLLKPLVDRKRPFARHPELRVIGRRPHDSSFPSAHAALAVAGAVVLSRLVPAGEPVWWSVAIAIMFSRMYLGDHYPLDVAGGAGIGALAAALVHLLAPIL